MVGFDSISFLDIEDVGGLVFVVEIKLFEDSLGFVGYIRS